jgi:hypothetical protein
MGLAGYALRAQLVTTAPQISTAADAGIAWSVAAANGCGGSARSRRWRQPVGCDIPQK